jgi:Sec-independent protein secretion pathway component TatC
MWQFSIGPAEIAIVLAVASLLWLCGRRGRLWMIGVVPCFAFAAAVTPADPASMLIVALPLAFALACGVFLAPLVRPASRAPASEKFC